MAGRSNRDGESDLDLPKSLGRRWWQLGRRDADALRRRALSGSARHRQAEADERERARSDAFGRAMEGFARAMGTPAFLVALTIFSVAWIAWNSIMPDELRFDSADIGFTALTLVLSLQASYAAPMILLAQNRQDDRDRVQIEQDRQVTARNTADLEYLMREIVALRMHTQDMASKDFIRAELRSLLEDIEALRERVPEPEPGVEDSAADAEGGAASGDASGRGGRA